MFKSITIVLVILCIIQQTAVAQSLFTDWAQGASPQEIGQKVTARFLQSPHAVYEAPNTKPHIPYFEVCTWYGALTFAQASGNSELSRQLTERFQPLFEQDSALLPVPDHIDYTVFGALPLELYLQTTDEKYLQLGKAYADTQWSAPNGPRVVPDSYTYYNAGLSWQTRLWIDDMYMISLVQGQAYRATGDTSYIGRAAKEMVFYLDQLQKPNGLFYHAPDAPFFWGRGNGWMAAGMTELLRTLPSDHPFRPRIMDGYQKMMQSLLQYQSEDGMWRQLVDDPASWPETSCTGMFCFAMITGVKNEWLSSDTYGPAARKAWLALVTYVNENGEITDVCEGTGKKNDRQYYLDRKRKTGDFHGQAPVLWCATALLRKADQ